MTTIWIDYAGNAVSRSGVARDAVTEVGTEVGTEVARSRELFRGESAGGYAYRSPTLSRLTGAVGAEFTWQGEVDLFDHQ